DDSALRKCKGSNKADKQPNQQLRATSCGEDGCYTGQTNRGSDCPCQQQLLAPESVDHAHRDQREDEVGEPDRDRLHITRNLVETGARENVVQIVENRVDSGKLVEHADRDGKDNGFPVTRLEKGLDAVAALIMQCLWD